MFSMVKSIQYFNEECAAKFEKLEDDFIKNPVDIAAYVTNITDILHHVGLKMIEETLGYLTVMLKESEIRKLNWVVDRNTRKQLITSLGAVSYPKTLYKGKATEERCFLLDLIMGMEPHVRMTEDAEARMLEEAVQSSYRRGGEQASMLDSVSKQTVKNKIHSLQFPPEDEVPETKKAPRFLFMDADEDHVSLQFQEKKGDLTKNLIGHKNNGMITKLVYVYEGIRPESPGSKRNVLINPHYFCSDSESEDNQAFWDRIFGYIDTHYDLGRVEKIYLSGDGGTWIEAGKNRVNGVIAVMDEFHLQKYLAKMTRHMKDSQSDAITDLRRVIMKGTKRSFRKTVERIREYLEESDKSGAENVAKGEKYILDNWMPCKVRLSSRKKLPGCSAEGHVSHVLSARMSTLAMGWSKRGAGRMARLRAYYYNGGDMLELVQYQKEELPMAAGCEKTFFTTTEIMRSERNRHYELGKYMESMQGSLPCEIKKKLWFNAHLTGL